MLAIGFIWLIITNAVSVAGTMFSFVLVIGGLILLYKVVPNKKIFWLSLGAFLLLVVFLCYRDTVSSTRVVVYEVTKQSAYNETPGGLFTPGVTRTLSPGKYIIHITTSNFEFSGGKLYLYTSDTTPPTQLKFVSTSYNWHVKYVQTLSLGEWKQILSKKEYNRLLSRYYKS